MARQILIVDDDPDISDTLREILVEEGHDVHVAADGRQALEQVTAHRPDLVLLDVGLPILSGPEVALTMFLRDAGLDRIPIILESAVRDLPRVARQVGTPYFLVKPFSLDEMLSLVDKALAEGVAPVPANA